jgi:nicotinate-nucleotide adenylyltransferase
LKFNDFVEEIYEEILMSSKQMRIGISGGTFDPIHIGHLIVAEQISETMNLDKVIFIPTGNPPHKIDMGVTAPEQRFDMLCEAITSNEKFEVSRIEIDRSGYTYTVDTLNQLRSIYGKDTILFFITGADVISQLTTWKNFEAAFKLCEFIAVLRPGYHKSEMLESIEYMRREYGAIIHVVEAPLIGISSTSIRNRVKHGLSIKYLVPDSVEKYILKKGLYD